MNTSSTKEQNNFCGNYISDIIRISDADKYKFNLIISGCGTGKSYFVTHTLLKQLPEIRPEEIIFVTSRALTVDQQARYDGLVKYTADDICIVNFWNNDDRIEDAVYGSGMRIMTYDKIINILTNRNIVGKETLSNVKAIVLDECHTLFSDTFIKSITALQVWIRDMLYTGTKLIIGMTATPGILFYNAERWGVTLKKLNKHPIMAYRANKMICTTFETIPYLLTTNRLPGKTLIMCAAVKDCFQLQAQIPNSAVLVSKNNRAFTPEMMMIRDYIAKYERLPDKFMVPSEAELLRRAKHEKPDKKAGTWYDLKVLITTTTAREGYNLSPASGIRNVVSCYSDDLHLTQICGRARYDLDHIVVAKKYIPSDNTNQYPYLTSQRKLFNAYMGNKQNTKWFSSVKHLVKHDVYGVKRFMLGTDEVRFVSYINEKWLVSSEASEEEAKRYRIWRKEDKNEIVQECINCKMLSIPDRYVTFNNAIGLLEGCLGYVVETGRFTEQKHKHTYKLVVSYDEDQRTYEPANPGVDELGATPNLNDEILYTRTD